MHRTQTVGAGVSASDDHNLLAGGKNVGGGVERIAVAALVLLRQKFHGVVNTLQLASEDFEIPRMLGAARQDDGVVVTAQVFNGNIPANLGIGDELHSLAGHL